MVRIMGIVNLTPDSFWAPSRSDIHNSIPRNASLVADGADIIDLGAVSTRPGAADVSVDEEWARLEPTLKLLSDKAVVEEYGLTGVDFSIDTTSSEIVKRSFDTFGPFIVNDISAGEDDAEMLDVVASLKLPYVAMHKRGNPRTMDSKCEYEGGVIHALVDYFMDFERRAGEIGIGNWILDPGLGFAKTEAQNWEILEKLEAFKPLHREILIGAADKRFTHGDTEKANRMAVAHGAGILRVHDVKAAVGYKAQSPTI
ncbi:MAG TPA: dihydropteroate synthase [Rikenellaceae bacterium]|nr:dihydropteroate synthase [Rikenellaceae bacterium]